MVATWELVRVERRWRPTKLACAHRQT
uniref:Uncharacterized protein n=1 Tax=Arundo donax TaxID=35708 RepID=A0A0A9ARE7_ARUDO